MQHLIWELKKKHVQGIINDWHEGQVSRRAPVLPAATGFRPGQHQEATQSLCHGYYKSHVCGMQHWGAYCDSHGLGYLQHDIDKITIFLHHLPLEPGFLQDITLNDEVITHPAPTHHKFS